MVDVRLVVVISKSIIVEVCCRHVVAVHLVLRLRIDCFANSLVFVAGLLGATSQRYCSCLGQFEY
jgi:hypothetical protein